MLELFEQMGQLKAQYIKNQKGHDLEILPICEQ